MKQLETSQRVTIAVKDLNRDSLTDREIYATSEYMHHPIFESEIFGNNPNKLGTFVCLNYCYDNYVIITDVPTIVCLMIEAKRITLESHIYYNLADINDKALKDFINLVS